MVPSVVPRHEETPCIKPVLHVRIKRKRRGYTRFLPQLIHLHHRGAHGESREERNLDRNKAEEGHGGTQHTEELSAILFYLSRLPLDRVHRFLTLASVPEAVVPAGTEGVCAKKRKVA